MLSAPETSMKEQYYTALSCIREGQIHNEPMVYRADYEASQPRMSLLVNQAQKVSRYYQSYKSGIGRR